MPSFWLIWAGIMPSVNMPQHLARSYIAIAICRLYSTIYTVLTGDCTVEIHVLVQQLQPFLSRPFHTPGHSHKFVLQMYSYCTLRGRITEKKCCIVHTVLINCITVLYEPYNTVTCLNGYNSKVTGIIDL